MTIGRESHPVPRPFLVMATQNPIESEGTYPLPEAQVDRFMMKVVVGYPSAAEEATVVERSLRPAAQVRAILGADGLAELQAATPTIYVDPAITAYAVAIVAATREPERVGQAALKSYIAFGASPRGSINLVHAARALALLRGRRYVIPSDIAELAPDVLRHRIVPSFAALAEEVTTDMLIDQIVPAVPAPRLITEARTGMTALAPRVRTPAQPGPGPTPEALLRALDLSIGRRIRGLVVRRVPGARPGRRHRARAGPARTSPATTSGRSTGTRRPACRCPTSASTSRSARSPRGSCSTSRRRWRSAPPIAARRTSRRGSRSRSATCRRSAATGSACSRSAA